jgi:hypothetical protein
MTGWLVFTAGVLLGLLVRFAWLALIPYKPCSLCNGRGMCSLCGFKGKRPKAGARMVRRAIGRPLP